MRKMLKKIISINKKMKPYKDEFGWMLSTATFIDSALGWNKRYERWIRNYLDKHYYQLAMSVQERYVANAAKNEKAEQIIWSIWWQGEVNLPEVVQRSRASLMKNHGNYKVVLLSQFNINEYITIPDYLLKLVEDKKVSFVHLADYIRVCILRKFGGIWLDATVFLLDTVPNAYLDHEFLSRHLPVVNPATVAGGRWSGYYMVAGEKNSLLYQFLETFYNQYFLDHKIVITYLLQDYLIDMAYRLFPHVRSLIENMPVNNEGMKYVQEHMNEDYDDVKWNAACQKTIFQKLSWKVPIEDNDQSFYHVVCCKE